jgi:hypothetical protein
MPHAALRSILTPTPTSTSSCTRQGPTSTSSTRTSVHTHQYPHPPMATPTSTHNHRQPHRTSSHTSQGPTPTRNHTHVTQRAHPPTSNRCASVSALRRSATPSTSVRSMRPFMKARRVNSPGCAANRSCIHRHAHAQVVIQGTQPCARANACTSSLDVLCWGACCKGDRVSHWAGRPGKLGAKWGKGGCGVVGAVSDHTPAPDPALLDHTISAQHGTNRRIPLRRGWRDAHMWHWCM